MRKFMQSLTMLAAFIAISPAMAALKSVSGTIFGYECGDNCYLNIKTKAGKEIAALCASDGCKAWNEQASIPEKLIGRSVKVTICVGKQLDGSGDEMGDFQAFTKVVVNKKQLSEMP
jgi:hypothetical protein